MAIYQVKIPSCVYAGEGSVGRLREILEREKTKSALVFTDPGIERAGILEYVTKELAQAGVDVCVIRDLTSEPAYTDIERVAREAKEAKGDLIVAVGGGSVMDAAKLVSLLQGTDYGVCDLLKNPSIACKQLKTVMIPTTCGTGAEATCNAIVAIPEEQTKQGIVNDAMIPDYVILDARMIRRLPRPIVAATGVDALAHAVECYTSRKATPLSDTYAMEGARLIFRNIRRAYSDPEDMEAKESMLLGAFYGGVAITASGTTAVHALSYPLGGRYHIAHGVSNAILFACVMEYNKEACREQLARLCDGVFPERSAADREEKAEWMIREIADIVRFTQIPADLKKFGVKPADLEELTEAGSKQTRLLQNNRRELSLSDIRAIYKKVL